MRWLSSSGVFQAPISRHDGGTTTVKDWLLGARYAIGPFTVSGGHWHGSAPWNGKDSWAGGTYTTGPHTFLAQVQKLAQANPAGAERKATVYGLAYTYALSKRSTLYATWGRSSNNATSSIALLAADVSIAPSVAGADPKATGIGIRHSF